MPIPPAKIWSSAPFAFVAPDERLLDALARPGLEDHHYLVVEFPDGRWVALRAVELRTMVAEAEAAGQHHRLERLPVGALLEMFAMPPLTAAEEYDSAVEYARQQLSERAVVVDDAGKFRGLLSGAAKRSSAEANPQIVRWLGQALSPPKMAMAGPPDTSGSQDPEAESAAAAPRYINVEVRDQHGQTFDARQTALVKAEPYHLLVDVDLEQRQGASAAAPFNEAAFAPGEEELELTVRLVSDDFDLDPAEGALYLPRQGQSINQLDFTIRPRHDGPGVINAIFLRQNNFVQALALKFYTGALFQVESAGRAVASAFALPRRDLNLTILEAPGGYQLVLSGPVAATASLPVTPPQLAQMVTQVRQALKEVVNTVEGGQAVYQAGLSIPPAAAESAALRLATEGFRLYQRLFFGQAADQQTRNLGEQLRKLLRQDDPLKIQIFARQFNLPWGLLYLSDERPKSAAEVDQRLFLGLRHVLENIPLQQSLQVLDSAIRAPGGLQVGLSLNADIGKGSPLKVVDEQVAFWQALEQAGQARLALRATGEQVLAALESAEQTPDQVMYFYCHAETYSLTEGQGPDASYVLLTGGPPLTLGQLELDAGAGRSLAGQPLVFLNACQSAELSPLFYENFVGYFMAKGARGVIGTECDTPALFAKEWALRFFKRFLAGEPLGEAALALRSEFAQAERNLLGLVYALYIDADTHLVTG